MADDALMVQIRDLHLRGYSPKEIARAVGVRPAVVAPLVRGVAAEAPTGGSEPAVVGCWVSPGWSDGLGVDGHPEWPGRHTHKPVQSGLVGVVVARERARNGRVSVCGYLLDTWCLGVKDALGPRTMDAHDLPAFVRRMFEAYDVPGIAAPIELAQALVFGAVDYARRLGFAPHRDFEPTARHLGPPPDTSEIRFGCDGKPYFVQGPYDNAARIMRTLEASVGSGNFHFLVEAGDIDFAVPASRVVA